MFPTPRSDPPGPGGSSPRRAVRLLPARLLVLTLVVAFWLGGFAVNNLRGSGAADWVNRVFFRVNQGDRLDDASIQRAWSIVQREYVIRGLNPPTGTAAAEQGIIEALRAQYGDRFSAYFTSQQYRSLSDQLSGRRAGVIGIEIEERCGGGVPCGPGTSPTVVAVGAVLHGSPAEKAGIRRGDVVVSVDGKALTGLGSTLDARRDRAGALIRGHAGTPAVLGLQRGPQSLDVAVTPTDLTLPSVYAQRFGPVLYLQVTGFDDGTTTAARDRLRDAVSSGATGVVLDLRENPGGLVTEAQGLASQFLAPSATVGDVVVRRGRLDAKADPVSAERTDRDAVEPGGVATSIRLSVLVDQDSASASEIVAAAMKDYHRGVLVGTKTFGKGSVQEDFGLPDGSDLHLTVEKWYGPGGESIDNVGITPDRAVSLPNEDDRFRLDAQGADAAADPQLQAALAGLSR